MFSTILCYTNIIKIEDNQINGYLSNKKKCQIFKINAVFLDKCAFLKNGLSV